MLDIYTDFAVNEAAIPVIPGRKSDVRALCRRRQTYSIEAMMGDGKALQAGTSHNLGQNFAKAFEIRYLDQDGVLQHCWTTSWGLSTRFIGAIIMVHGDDQGLILPPRLAPHQVVIVPIFKTDEEKASVLENAHKLEGELVEADIRVKLDEREGMSPGFKFNDWEMRGVPLRLELGPKDVAKRLRGAGAARPSRQRRASQFVLSAGHCRRPSSSCSRKIQKSLLDQALAFRKANTTEPPTYDEFKKAVETGFAFSPVVRRRRLRSEDQGRDQGHHALHSVRSARDVGQLRLLRQTRDRERNFRSRLLSFRRVTPANRAQSRVRRRRQHSQVIPFHNLPHFVRFTTCFAVASPIGLAICFPGTSFPANSRHVQRRVLRWNQPKSA